MNTIIRFALWMVAVLVSVYPVGFRRQFEEEMRLVFADAIKEAATCGRTALIALSLRELRDWPRTVLSEYWVSVITWSAERVTRPATRNSHVRNTTDAEDIMQSARLWKIDNARHAMVAALPPLLFGLGIAAATLVRGGAWYAVPPWQITLSLVTGFIAAGLIAAGALVAVARHVPDWGYTWMGATLIGMLLAVEVLHEEFVEEATMPVASVLVPALGMLTLLLILAALGAAALRGWLPASVVSIGMAAIAGLSLCQAVASGPFHRNDLALVAAPAGLLEAALTYLYVRRPGPARMVAFAGFWLLNVGLNWMASEVWGTWLVARDRPSMFWPMLAFLTVLLVAGSVLSLLGWPLRRALVRR